MSEDFNELVDDEYEKYMKEREAEEAGEAKAPTCLASRMTMNGQEFCGKPMVNMLSSLCQEHEDLRLDENAKAAKREAEKEFLNICPRQGIGGSPEIV